MQNFIDDGYTEKGYIAAVRGLHDEVRFEYRPVPYKERTIIADAARNRPPEVSAKTVVACVVKFLVSWSFEESITTENVSRLRPRLVDGLYYKIIGIEPSDPDPLETDIQADEADRELNAILGGTTKEMVDQKN